MATDSSYAIDCSQVHQHQTESAMTGGPLVIYHRLRLWWLRGGRHRAVIASGTFLVTAFLLTLTAWIRGSSSNDPDSLVPLGPNLVDLTLVRNATEKGARTT